MATYPGHTVDGTVSVTHPSEDQMKVIADLHGTDRWVTEMVLGMM